MVLKNWQVSRYQLWALLVYKKAGVYSQACLDQLPPAALPRAGGCGKTTAGGNCSSQAKTHKHTQAQPHRAQAQATTALQHLKFHKLSPSCSQRPPERVSPGFPPQVGLSHGLSSSQAFRLSGSQTLGLSSSRGPAPQLLNLISLSATSVSWPLSYSDTQPHSASGLQTLGLSGKEERRIF